MKNEKKIKRKAKPTPFAREQPKKNISYNK
jgi:hypothetical protein